MNIKKLLLRCLDNRQKNTSKNPKELLRPEYVKSILIRPLGYAIGDAVVHTAHLQQLRTIYPHAILGVLVTPNKNSTIFEKSGLVDKLIERKFCQYLKQRKKWDLLLDFENNFNSSSLIADKVLSPKLIMIFRKYDKKYYNLSTIKNYDFHCPQADTDRLSHYLSNSLFANFNLPSPYSTLPLIHYNNEENKYWQENKIRLLLCPQGSKRELPEQELANLLNQSISKELEEKVQLILGYTPTAETYTQKLTDLCPNLSISCSPPTDLSQYLSLVKSADIVIAVDGGSLHIACAFAKPLLSFFANSSPNLEQWQPLVYPAVPALRIISYLQAGRNSNLTQGFDLTEGILWLKEQLIKQAENRILH